MHDHLRDLRYFAAIAEHGQVQRAASALGMSQPALSKSLNRLERALNAKLLMRTPKGVELTSVGAALLSQVERLQRAVNDIFHEAADLSEGRSGHLHVGTGPDLSLNLLPLACAAMVADAPRTTLRVTVGTADVLLPALSRGELDLTVTASVLSGYPDLVSEPLMDEMYAVYCSVKHRLARKKKVTLADLSREQWTLAVASGSLQQLDLHRVFAAKGLPDPRVAVESNSVAVRMHLLPVTDLLGFLPKRTLHGSGMRDRLKELPIKGLSYRRTIAVCYRKDAYLSPVGKKFIHILKQAITQSV